MNLFCNDISLDGLLREQYYLARKCGISVSESEHMADFERYVYLSLYSKELKDKLKNKPT